MQKNRYIALGDIGKRHINVVRPADAPPDWKSPSIVKLVTRADWDNARGPEVARALKRQCIFIPHNAANPPPPVVRNWEGMDADSLEIMAPLGSYLTVESTSLLPFHSRASILTALLSEVTRVPTQPLGHETQSVATLQQFLDTRKALHDLVRPPLPVPGDHSDSDMDESDSGVAAAPNKDISDCSQWLGHRTTVFDFTSIDVSENAAVVPLFK